ncbi:MAG: glycosyltransferase family 39 protein [Chthoniobacterales bacterium]
MSRPELELGGEKILENGKVWMALFAAILISMALVLSAEINRPWINGVDFNGAVWAQSAHNILRAGLIETAGASSGFYYGPLPIPAWGYYLHHPPLLHLAIAFLFAIFGEHEWVARLVPLLCCLTGTVFLWLLVRSCAGARVATLSAAVFAFLPMQLRYGPMVNLCCLLRAKNGDRRFAGILFLSALLSGVLYLVRIALLRPDAWQNLSHTFLVRLGASNGGHFTELQWITRIADTLVTHFLPTGLILGGIGAVILWRARSRGEGWQWLARAATTILVMDLLFVGIFQNDSFIHQYLAFYLLAPIAIAAGLTLDRLIDALRLVTTPRLFPRTALVFACLLLLALGWSGVHRERALVRRFRILDYHTDEPAALIPELGKAIRATFPAGTLVLCNFLPDYGPQLAYYAQRDIVNNLSEYRFWSPRLSDTSQRVGGVVWVSPNPSSQGILANLPPGRKRFLTVGSLTFCLWKRGETRDAK